ncbi:MAG: peptidylprolyl isomerase [Halobacteriovoraceae bacterium]|nr:peptidylprolyl isomerase [Halobacteriovoraceae bacterium]|tara:strand:+ start:26709 stop:27410 length:702 start_codon:yes stop_codon:yes gene_type:complete
MKRFTLITAVLFLFSACNQGQKAGDVSLKTEDDKTFYSMGYMFGSNLQRLSLTDEELAALYKGLRDSAKGTKAEVDLQVYQPKIQMMFKSRMEKVAKEEKQKGEGFIKDYMKKNPEAKKTESGLVYKVIKAGSDKKPSAEDTVKVHYHGTLVNGEVFDSSVERGDQITFPLNRVIKGWTEGLQLIGEGGKIELVIPPELAYGEQGAPPKIPGGATLKFEVELFEIMPKEEKKK